MRQFNFRFWNITLRKMEFDLLDTNPYYQNPFSRSDIIPMQSTGLQDKNEKEIWEGDVILVNHPNDFTKDFTNSKQKVFWYPEEGAFYHGNGNRPPKRMWEYCEVLGNIYENPELLK